MNISPNPQFTGDWALKLGLIDRDVDKSYLRSRLIINRLKLL